MANTDKPRGATLAGDAHNGSLSGKVNRYHIAATYETDMFVGDFVKSSGSAHTDGTPQVEQAAATETLLGVVVSFEPDPDTLNTLYRAADTARYVYVADSPDLIFKIQADDVTSTLAATDMGSNADIIVGTGDTTRGLSAMEIDSESATTSAAQLRILRPSTEDDNEAFVANADYLVMINEHERKSTTGT